MKDDPVRHDPYATPDIQKADRALAEATQRALRKEAGPGTFYEGGRQTRAERIEAAARALLNEIDREEKWVVLATCDALRSALALPVEEPAPCDPECVHCAVWRAAPSPSPCPECGGHGWKNTTRSGGPMDVCTACRGTGRAGKGDR